MTRIVSVTDGGLTVDQQHLTRQRQEGTLVGARLQFIEEPRILDRDYRLVGKACDQCDLFIRVRLDSQPTQRNSSYQIVVAQQRDGD